MAELTDTEIRRAAVECASRSVERGAPTGHYLSSARLFETYIRSGISQTGPRFQQGVLAGTTGAVVRVDGDLTPAQAELVVRTITDLLTKEH